MSLAENCYQAADGLCCISEKVWQAGKRVLLVLRNGYVPVEQESGVQPGSTVVQLPDLDTTPATTKTVAKLSAAPPVTVAAGQMSDSPGEVVKIDMVD
jgi:hypothetical protein